MVNKLRKKFEDKRVNAILTRYEKLLGINVYRARYKKKYVAIWPSLKSLENANQDLRKDGIEVLSMNEVFHKILYDVSDKIMTEKGVRTLPESLWLLKMVEFLVAQKIIPVNEY